MRLTDAQIRDKLVYLLTHIYREGRITEIEFNRIVFYGLYNNEWFGQGGIVDLDECGCSV